MKMTPERWQQIDDLLQAALERPEDERAGFLDGACNSDAELRHDVESLLRFHGQADNFLEKPPADLAAVLIAEKNPALPFARRINHYLLEHQIGHGGMGIVYLARDTRLGRLVALKLLQSRFTQDEDRVRRFQQEARAASALNHPNILTIHEVGQADDTYFIATEFVEGQTLRVLMRDGTLMLPQILDIMTQAAGALCAAHNAGIVHRDLKPENIMLRPDGYVKVLDFGLAKLNERSSAERNYSTRVSSDGFTAVETNPGMVLGTVSYMSPEQARGQEMDERTDIFSLGVVLYEMVAGQEPFPGPTSYDVLAAVLHSEPQPLAQFNPQVPAELQRIINRALAKDREARYQRMTEFCAELKTLKQQLEQGVKLKPAAPTNPIGPRTALLTAKRWRTAFVVLALLVLSVAIYLIWVVPVKPSTTIQTVAVLPFKPLAAGQRDEVLEIGIADTLITRLSRLNQLSVAPIGAVRRYNALDQDPVAAGRELHVQAVLDGSIQRANDKIRITARLIKVADGKPLWTSQFDERWTDIFNVQDAIAQRFADDLQTKLSGAERNELTRNYTNDPEAYSLFLRGRYHWNTRTPDGMNKSLEYFQQAIARDKNYAQAYVGIADAYSTLGSYHIKPAKETGPAAREAAEKALAIDPDLAEAHASLGKVFTEYYWDGERAEYEFKRAIALRPTYGNAHHWYSTLLASHLGRFDEGVREARRALELDQYSPVVSTQLGSVLYRARRYDESIVVLRQTLDLNPNYVTAYYFLGLCFLAQGQLTQARDFLQQGHALAPKSGDFIALLGYTAGLLGQIDETRRYQVELNELVRQRSYVSPFCNVILHKGLGEMDQVFKWLDIAYNERDPGMRGLKTDPLLDSLRSDTRFIDLIRRVYPDHN